MPENNISALIGEVRAKVILDEAALSALIAEARAKGILDEAAPPGSQLTKLQQQDDRFKGVSAVKFKRALKQLDQGLPDHWAQQLREGEAPAHAAARGGVRAHHRGGSARTPPTRTSRR